MKTVFKPDEMDEDKVAHWTKFFAERKGCVGKIRIEEDCHRPIPVSGRFVRRDDNVFDLIPDDEERLVAALRRAGVS